MVEHRILQTGWIEPEAVEPYERQRAIEGEMISLNRLIDKGGYDQKRVAEGFFALYGAKGCDKETAKEQEKFLSLLPDKVDLADGQSIGLKDCTAVDLGSGPGILTSRLVDKVKKIIPIDSAPAMIKFIEEHPEVFPPEKVAPKVGDFTDGLPLDDESVEILLAGGVVPEIPPGEENQFLSEIMRVLKPGGKAIVDSVYYIRDNPEITDYRKRQVDFFERDRREGVTSFSYSRKKNPQRAKVFLDTELKEKFAEAGYEVDVDPAVINPETGKEYEKGNISVVITKKSKLRNET